MTRPARSVRRWLRRSRRGYRGVVGNSRPQQRLAPIPRPAGLEQYAGMWVAVIAGEVVAAEETSRALAFRLHQMDHLKRRRAVMEYVRPTAAAYVVGAG